MANYSRKDLEDQGNAEVGLGVGALLGLAALAIGGVNSSANKKRQKEQIEAQIRDIDRKINDLQSGLLGSWLNSDEIDQLQAKRRNLVKQLNEL